MKLETICFVLKKNFGGSFEVYEDYCIYYLLGSSYRIEFENNYIICCEGFRYDLRENVSEITIIDFFMNIINKSTLYVLSGR